MGWEQRTEKRISKGICPCLVLAETHRTTLEKLSFILQNIEVSFINIERVNLCYIYLLFMFY